MATEKTKLGSCDKGSEGMSGQDYRQRIARVYRIRPGRYELYVRAAYGSNQGRLEEHSRCERTYRAGSIDDLLRIGVSEVGRDADLEDYCGSMGVDQLAAAIREACIEAEDAEALEPGADVARYTYSVFWGGNQAGAGRWAGPGLTMAQAELELHKLEQGQGHRDGRIQRDHEVV